MGRSWKIISLGTLITMACLISSTAIVAAHVLERDGDISAVLHMPPTDTPVAGESTVMNLAFAAGREGFDIADYDVGVNVVAGGKTIGTATMESLDQSPTDSTATFTLPRPGAYELVVTGQPGKGSSNDVRPFRLVYEVRAGNTGNDAGTGRGADVGFWAISIGSWLLLGIVAASRIRSGGRYAKDRERPNGRT